MADPIELRLIEDTLSGGSVMPLPPLNRVLYLVHGAATVAGVDLTDDTAWQGRAAIVTAGASGAAIWRYELAPAGSQAWLGAGAGVRSSPKLAVALDTLPAGELLMRCDSVSFPPGGCAFRHVHQGPGIRCLIEGGIRIDTDGHSIAYGPGGAWFEAGPIPVFAQAAIDRPSRFIRVMVLPRALLGQSSIRYVDAADRDKPKTQTYKGYVDAPIDP